MDNNPRTGTTSGHGWHLATIAGVPVQLARSWALIAIVAIAIFAPIATRWFPNWPAGVILATTGFIGILLLAVITHELGHALLVHLHGNRVHSIVISGWGGHTSFTATHLGARAMLLIAAAGPLTNLLFALLFHLAYTAIAATGESAILQLTLSSGTLVNLLMGVFNLLPVIPLDGARIVEAVLWALTGNRATALRTTAWLGRVTIIGGALTLALTPWATNTGPYRLIILILFAAIGWRSSSAALAGLRRDKVIDGLTTTALMRPACAVTASAPITEVEVALAGSASDVVVLTDPSGRAIAYATREQLGDVPAHARPRTPVGAVGTRLNPSPDLDVGLSGSELYEQIRVRSATAPTLVVSDDRNIRGVIHVRDLINMLKAT